MIPWTVTKLRSGAAWFAAGAALAGGACCLTLYSPFAVHERSPQEIIQVQRPLPLPTPVPSYVPGRLLVRFRDNGLDHYRLVIDLGAVNSRPSADAPVAKVPGADAPDSGPAVEPIEVDQNPDTHDVTVHFDSRIPVEQAAAALRRDPAVVFAEPDGVYQALYTPNDPYYDENYDSSNGPLDQWYLPKISAPAAWDVLRKIHSKVRLAIIDTGIDYDHPDLKGIMAKDSKGEPVGKNFVDGGDPKDDHGHGTHCAGIAAADTDNEVGVAGVGFHSFELVSAKVLTAEGQGQWDSIANAITWCADNGCRVESMSLGGGQYSQGIQDAINYAWKKGVIVVAAAGNSATSRPSYPAGNNHVVAVSATDPNDKLCTFSNFGAPVAVGAPGIRILATIPTYPCTMTRSGRIKNNYDGLAGTSMACPVVAGTLAALLAYQPTLTPTQAIQRMEQGADNTAGARDGGWERQFGHGRVNLANTILNHHRAAKLGSFYGQVTNAAGTPIPGATVRCGQTAVTTRSDGMFRLANLKAGHYTITASGDGQTGKISAAVVLGADTDASLTVKSG